MSTSLPRESNRDEPLGERSVPSARARRDKAAPTVGDTAGSPALAHPMALLAEVERLTRELEEARAENRRLAALADEDALCRILNRRGFDRAFASALAHVARYGETAALLIIDLDDFKRINDEDGHQAGDALLRAVAAHLVAHLRASDVVARIGGDEFAVILWRVDEAAACAKAEVLRTGLPARASFGVASLGGTDPALVMRRADDALYADKRRRSVTR